MTVALKSSSASDSRALLLSLGLHGGLIVASLSGATASQPPPITFGDSAANATSAVEVETSTEERPAPLPAPRAAAPLERAPVPTPAVVRRDARSQLSAELPRAESTPKVPLRESGSPGTTAAGPVGQERLGAGVRRLGYAFTRAIPAAALADPEWQELPVGPAGTIGVELPVDERQQLGPPQSFRAQPERAEPPAVLTRLIDRTLLLLRGGRFALSTSNQPGVERLVVEVVVRGDEAGASAGAVLQQSFSGATPRRPGKAYVRYDSGRALEVTVTVSRAGSSQP